MNNIPTIFNIWLHYSASPMLCFVSLAEPLEREVDHIKRL